MVSTAITGNDFLTVNASTDAKKTDNTKQVGSSFEDVIDSLGKSDDYSADKSTGKTGKADEIRKLFVKDTSTGNTDNNKIQNSEDDMLSAIQQEISELVGKIIKVIEDTFKVSDEEVKAAINELDMNTDSLISGNGLAELVTKLTGKEDVMQILTDTDLSQMFKETMDAIKNIVAGFIDETGVSDEQLNEITGTTDLASLISDTDEMPETANVETDGDIEFVPQNTNDEQVTDTSDKVMQKPDEGIIVKSTEPQKSESDMSESYDDNAGSETLAENFVNTLSDIIEENVSEIEDVKPEHIIRQIVDEIKVSIKEDISSMEMQLNPEHLGKLNLQIASRNGMITAQIMVQNEITKEAIESQVVQLKESLDNQGIKVEAVEVTVGSRQFAENFDSDEQDREDNQKHKKHISQSELDEINGITRIQENIEEEMMKLDGNTVSIRA